MGIENLFIDPDATDLIAGEEIEGISIDANSRDITLSLKCGVQLHLQNVLRAYVDDGIDERRPPWTITNAQWRRLRDDMKPMYMQLTRDKHVRR